MINDLRFALRMVWTRRWFSAAVIVTLALGIGINTTVFTLVNAVLFKGLGVEGGDRIVTIMHQDTTRPDNFAPISYPDFRDYRAQSRTLEQVEAAGGGSAIISEPDNAPTRYSMARVTTGLFELLHTPAALGRGFVASDGRAGAEAVALIGYSVWQNRYGGDRGVIGRHVRINGTPTTIVGVMPEGFRFPSNEDVWQPLAPGEDRANRELVLFGRLKPNVTLEAADRDIAVIGGRIATEFASSHKNVRALARTFNETYNGGQIRGVFLLLLGAVGFVLLIACANVANMMLSRAIGRAREMSVRAAMGAARWQLVRQLLIESVLLSCLGGALGLGLAAFGVHAFDLATRDVGKPYWIIFRMDWVVFAYFAAICVISGVVFGLVPALRASRVDLNTTLKEGAPGGGGGRGGKLTAMLVVLQFALTVILLAGAGMMIRSFEAAQRMNAFIPSDQLLTARVQMPEGKGERYADGDKRARFFEDLLPALRALPGVTHAAAVSFPPANGAPSREIEIEGRPRDTKPLMASMIVQTPDYQATVGIPLLLGRSLRATDGEVGKEAVLVSRGFAQQHWPGVDAIGKRFRHYNEGKPGPWMTVVGVCADVVQNPHPGEPVSVYYVPHRQEPWGWMALVLRTTGDPTPLAAPLRAAVQKLDPDLPLFEVRTFAGSMQHEFWFLRVFGTMFGLFALAGLLMAAVGVYAVVAQSSARRTREIGIRMALGATAGAILRLVLSRGLTQLIVGLVLGLAGAVAATRLMMNIGILVQVSPNDPVVFIGIAAILSLVGTLACWLPARRAAALHPVAALRDE